MNSQRVLVTAGAAGIGRQYGGAWFARDSLLEGAGFELSVPLPSQHFRRAA